MHVILLLLLFACIPIETENHGYQAVLWGFSRERVITQNDVGGNPGLMEYYHKNRIRIFCFTVTTSNLRKTRIGQGTVKTDEKYLEPLLGWVIGGTM